MRKNDDQNLLISYLRLRQLIGAFGFGLPWVMMVGGFVLCRCHRILPSISDYYALRTRDVFVGMLFSIACFMFTYKGYELIDDVLANVAGVTALGVALFPNSGSPVQAFVHFGSAAALLVVLACFSLFLFTKTSGSPTPQKLIRNRVYIVCGLLILVCIGSIGLYRLLWQRTALARLEPVFWLETVALCSFGFSWFVKGETLWRDK